MDLSQYLPEDLAAIAPGQHQQDEEETRKFKERIQDQSIEIQQVANELFDKMVHKRKFETTIKSLQGRLDKETKNLTTKVLHQNHLAELVNLEQNKHKALEQQATEAANRVKENRRKMQERRRKVDGYGEYVIQCHDSIQSVNGEIAMISGDIRQFKERENEQVPLNVALEKNEREMRDISNSIKVTEVMIVKLDVSHQRQVKDIEVLAAQKNEVQAILTKHLDERARLQKELEDFSMENKINNKLDELKIVLQRHEDTLMEMQSTHDEQQMRILEQQKKEADETSEALQKALDELDRTLAQQDEDLERANEELSSLNTDRAQDNPVLRGFQLELEKRNCEVNQLEEQIMHVKDELDDLNCKEQSDSDISIAETEIRPAVPSSLEGGSGDNLRTSTPQSKRPHSAMDRSPDESVASRVSGSRLNMSFGSASIPSTIPPSVSQSGGKRRRGSRRQVDVEVSSTQC